MVRQDIGALSRSSPCSRRKAPESNRELDGSRLGCICACAHYILMMDDLQNLGDDWGVITESRREEKAKQRQCLICSELFLSEWSGERICKRCKSSSTWRSGLA